MQRRDFLRLTAAAGTAAAVGDTATEAPVTRWAARHATSLEDLASLEHSIGDALIVGLGESVHGVAEELRLKHRLLRLLVERMGVRSVAWEEDWHTGRQIDRYVGAATATRSRWPAGCSGSGRPGRSPTFCAGCAGSTPGATTGCGSSGSSIT